MRKLHIRTDVIITVIGIGCLIDTVVFGLIAPLIPIHATELGADDVQLGMLFAAYGITATVLMIPFGILSDKIGRVPVVICGNFAGIGILLYANANSIPALMICRIIQGISAALTWVSSFALIADLYPPSERGQKMGVAGIFEGVGYIIGPATAGGLAKIGGYSSPFFFSTALTLVVSFLSVIAFRKIWSIGARRASSWMEYKRIFLNRSILVTCVLTVIISATWGFLEAFYPKYLSSTFAYDSMAIGILFTIAMVVYAIGRIVFGTLSDRIGRKPILIAGMIIAAIIMPFLFKANGFVTAAIGLATIFMAITLTYSVVFPLIFDTVTSLCLKGEPYGAASGIMNIAWTAGFAIGPLSAGYIIELSNLNTLCIIYAVVFILCALLGFFLVDEPSTRD
mgnify:CR=1 FL=1